MLSLTSVSASEVVIGDVANELILPCQRVRAMTDSRSTWQPEFEPESSDHKPTAWTTRPQRIVIHFSKIK